MINQVVRKVWKSALLAMLGAMLVHGIATSGGHLKAEEAGCADYACAADDECKNHSCDLCGKDKRCLKSPGEEEITN